MRNLIQLSTAIALFTLMSCSKKNANPNLSTWTFNGNTYTSTAGGYDSSGNIAGLGTDDAAGNTIGASFNFHPTKNGTYPISSDVLSSFTPARCSISLSGYNSPNYLSTGKTGDVVNVTIVNGKLHVSFSNITIEDGKDTTTVSGTIVQVTYE
jgi:hypothetical protein